MRPGTNRRLYTGGSMAKVFQFGDTLIFKNSELHRIKPGDVLIYKDFGRTRDGVEIVHRVRKIFPKGMLMQGDNNPYPDTRLATAKNTTRMNAVCPSATRATGKLTPIHTSPRVKAASMALTAITTKKIILPPLRMFEFLNRLRFCDPVTFQQVEKIFCCHPQ